MSQQKRYTTKDIQRYANQRYSKMLKDVQKKIFKYIQTKDIQRCWKMLKKRYLKIFKPKIFKPKIFKDIQTKDIQRYSKQRYSKTFKPPGGMPGTPSRQVCFPLHSCTHLVGGGIKMFFGIVKKNSSYSLKLAKHYKFCLPLSSGRTRVTENV